MIVTSYNVMLDTSVYSVGSCDGLTVDNSQIIVKLSANFDKLISYF